MKTLQLKTVTVLCLLMLFMGITIKAQEVNVAQRTLEEIIREGGTMKPDKTKQSENKCTDNEIRIRPFGTNCIPRKIKIGQYIPVTIDNINTVFVKKSKLSSVSRNDNFSADSAAELQANFTIVADTMTINANKSGGIITVPIAIKDTEYYYKKFLASANHLRKAVNLKKELIGLLDGDSVFVKNVDALKANSRLLNADAYQKLNYDDLFTNVGNTFREFQMQFQKENEIAVKDSAKLQMMSNATRIYEIINNEANAEKDYKIAMEGIILYNFMQKDDFAFHTEPIQFNGDYEVITPILKNTIGEVIYTFNPITLSTYGSWKADVSSGYMLSFKGNENYSLISDGDGNRIGVKEGNLDEISHAFGVLAHVYYDFKSEIKPAVSAGISANQNATVGFYGGVSFMMKSKTRFIATLGWSYIKLKKMDRSNINDDLRFTTQDTEIRYDEVFTGAPFIGITFNLTNTIK